MNNARAPNFKVAPFVDGKGIVSPGGNMEVIRSCTDEEKILISDSFQSLQAIHTVDMKELYWINVFLNGKLCTPFPQADDLESFVKTMVDTVYADWKERHILSVSFVINPIQSAKDQKFHCDYTYTSSNLFIPLTKVTHLNATQFIRTPLKHSRMDQNNNFSGGDIFEIMKEEGTRSLEVGQVVCEPYSIIHLHPFTPHRGIRNLDNYARVLLCVAVDSFHHEVAEETVFKELDEYV